MQSKMTVRHPDTPTRLPHIKSSEDTNYWHRSGDSHISPWECGLAEPLRKTVPPFLPKLNTHLPYDPEIPLLGIYPREMKS